MGMTVRLSDNEAAALRAFCEMSGRSMQEVARSAIREYIERADHGVLLHHVLDAELPRCAEALERLGE